MILPILFLQLVVVGRKPSPMASPSNAKHKRVVEEEEEEEEDEEEEELTEEVSFFSSPISTIYVRSRDLNKLASTPLFWLDRSIDLFYFIRILF